MSMLETTSGQGKNPFHVVADPFVQQPGLPFAQVLTAEQIAQAFADHDGLFAQDDLFSTSLVLWAFLAQVLSGL